MIPRFFTWWRFLQNPLNDRRGTALLVALLVMGVLISVSLILSSLIFRETRLTRDLVDSGRAYYAAESGVELALLGLEGNLPGWEPETDGDDYKSFAVDFERRAVGEFQVNNRCNAYPCFDEEFDVTSVVGGSEKVFYDVLDLNESITIPLFIVDEDGAIVKDVEHFVVEFFAPFNPQLHLNLSSGTSEALAGWDVLRWKVFGIHKDHNVTETISDFTALSMLTNAVAPSWFGSTSCSEGLTEEQLESRYTDRIACGRYYVNDLIEVDPTEFGQVSTIYAGSCSQSEAREYYLYEYSGDERRVNSENIYGCYPIKQFLSEHKLNYLSLTNLINPAVFRPELSPSQKAAFSKLYFRVELFGGAGGSAGLGNQTVREYAEITANGYSGNAKQSISVRIRRGSFMPVFHFSLYSTYMDEARGHDEEYWYGEEELGL